MISILAVVLAYCAGVVVGIYLDYLNRQVVELKGLVEALWQRKADVPAKPQSTGAVIVDPDDLVQRAKYERDQMMKGLNSDE